MNSLMECPKMEYPQTESLREHSVEHFPFYLLVKKIVEGSHGRVAPGRAGSITKEAVLFSANPSLAFPVRDVERVCNVGDTHGQLPKVEMTVNFGALYGCASPLPEFYSEDILYSGREVSPSGRFLDVFNHRLLSFIYRSWEQCRRIDEYEVGSFNAYANILFSFFGMKATRLRKNSQIRWERLLPFALALQNGDISAANLRKIIANYFSLDHISITQFVEQRLNVPEREKNCLGVRNSTLSDDCSLGESVECVSGRFRLKIGPLPYKEFRRFLPDGLNYKILRQLIAFTVKRPLTMQIELIVDSVDIPPLVLADANIFQLGFNAWLGKPLEKQFKYVS